MSDNTYEYENIPYPEAPKGEPEGCGATCSKPICDKCADESPQPEAYTQDTWGVPAPVMEEINPGEEDAGGCSTCKKPECDGCSPIEPEKAQEYSEAPLYEDTPPDCSATCEKPECDGCPPPEEAPQAPSLKEELERIENEISTLNKLFATKIQRTDYDTKVIDQMHGDLEKHKEDMYSKIMRPVLMDIISLRDDMMRIVEANSINAPEKPTIPLGTFEVYAYTALDILERYSVEAYKSEVGDDFTPIKHRVLKKVATPDQNLNKKIAKSVSDGYSYMGKVISAEKVEVYAYDPNFKEDL